ncbi:MAG: PAS domain S-box protein [Alphaproteobacteria bacterium]|nr:PAS domain S-box protein [Alphaproteobacteria bacterium]
MRQSSRSEKPDAAPDESNPPEIRAFSVSNDVSDDYPVGERTLADMQQIVRESELLSRIAVKTNEAATLDEAIQACLDEVCDYTGWPVGHAYMPATGGTGELESTKLWHIDDPEQYENYRQVTEATHYTYEGMPGRVMAEATPQWMVSDATYQQFPRANARIDAGLKSGFAFPAMANKAVVAVLEFFSPQVIEPDQQFLSITAEIGFLIGQAIERRQAEQALNDSEIRYRQLAELSPDGMFVLVDSKIVFANTSLAKILAAPSPDDLIGKPVNSLHLAEYQAEIEQRRTKVMRTEVVKLAQSDFLRLDGSRVPVERSAARITWKGEAAIVVHIRDVTDRVEAERALEESRDQLRLVTDNLPVLIAYIDAEQRFRFANKTCTEWLARPVEDVLGKTTAELFGQEYEKLRPRINRALAGEQLSYVESINYPDGVTRTIRATHVPHRGLDNNIEGYFVLGEDVSELRRTEEQLSQAQKMEAVGQLTGGVAHDFNNLLAVILGNAELLGDQIGDNLLLATIDRAATRGAELTQRLLAFSRRQALEPRLNDLTELIPNILGLLRRTLGEPVKILTDIPEDVWPVVVDSGQLESALLNLSINARDAMPDGGVLEIRCSNVELLAGDHRVSDGVTPGDYVQIAVRDSGAGMPAEVLEHAFEPFYTTKDVGEGSGLGLSMVYGFARQSGGDAVIESAPGKGTEVSIFLPRSEVTIASDERIQDSDLKRGQKEVILVLEDDPDVRSFAVVALEGLDYRALEAGDANAALRVLEEAAGNIDLLLCDVVLPGGVSGPELAANLKNLYPELKFVFMSGYAADLYTHDKIPGFDEPLLTKPFKRADLAQVIHDTLAI